MPARTPFVPVACFLAVSVAVPRSVAAGVVPAASPASAPEGGPALDPDSESWDVSLPHGPAKSVAFSTSEGTWMSVDLHPDGSRFVFDLLGDLYELPIGGGTAKRLSSGPAWDAEPRYSPDGRAIAFSSDRGGNTNLWVMGSDGSEPRPVTRETEVRVQDPAWDVDGSWIVGRVRHTDTSSIGLFELWTFHLLGGKGVQLTKKEERAGAAEPAVSPDGRWIYFSSRAERYAYNRNPHQGIWQVARLDRRTGQIRPLTGEGGGAARPVPSPDGSRLAIVRRAGAQTWLEIYDLASGARRKLADWLDHDEQEGFAIGGIYPRYDWFPDGKELLLTAQGGFWRVDAQSGARRKIEFSAQVELPITEAVRPQRAAARDEVQARMIRWPSLSPDGKVVVFSALGNIWRMDLPAGRPQRLSADEGWREYAPSWSPDGKQVAYVSWDDEAGGALRTIPSKGGKSKVISRVGPKYSNPSFAPDGRSIVAIRGSGAHLRQEDLGSELWSDVVLFDLASGREAEVTATTGLFRAARPRFSADGSRILFPEETTEEEHQAAKGQLISVNRDGTDRRVLLQVGNAQEIVPSPDGRWIVFKERHHAWIAALPATGWNEPLSVERDEGGPPAIRLSEVAGDWVDFGGGGAFVSWVFGNEFHRVELAALLSWETERQAKARAKEEEEKRKKAERAEGAGEGPGDADADEGEDGDGKPETPPSEAVVLDLRMPRARPAAGTAVAVTGARIVTMRGDEVLESATLVTDRDRIVALGPDGQVAIPKGAHVIDARGKTVIPGMIDVHAHLHFSALDVLPEQEWRYLANLAYGVTTVHDPSVFTDEAFAYGELVEAGRMTGPRVFSTGEILYGATGNFRSDVQSLDDARRHVRRMKQVGAISVKSYQQPRREQRQWIVQACREEGMLDIPEGGGDLFGNLGMVLDGHSAIEHALPVTPLYQDVVRLFAASGTFYSPTLLVAYGGAMGEHFFFAKDPVWKDQRLRTFMPRSELDARARRLPLVAAEDDWHHQDVARGAAAIQRAGGHVTLGAHGQLQGQGAHWELWGLAGPGAMTPLEALRSATLNGAIYLGMEKELGSIEPGKLADFVVLDRNPLENIENSDSVRWVVKNGVLYDAATMNRAWPEPAERARLTWETARDSEARAATTK